MMRDAGRTRAVMALAQRDLLEFVRDRRTLFVTLLMPMAMYPVLALASMLGVRSAVADLEARQAPRRLALAVTGGAAEAFADRLREVLETAGRSPGLDWPAAVVVETPPAADVPARLDAGDVDAWIEVGDDAVATLDGRDTLTVDVRLPTIRPAGGRQRGDVVAVLRALAEDTRRRRVASAGLPDTVLEPVVLSFVDVPGDEGGPGLQGILPTAVGGVLVLLALLTATGAFYPAIDAIAGEKERGTIETLLIAPCAAGDIALGKFLAVYAVTLATLAANTVSIALTAAVLVRLAPAGVTPGIGPAAVAVCALVALVAFMGLAAVAAALCLAVTCAARSTKEAQNTLTPVILLVSGLAGAALLPGFGGAATAALPFAGPVAVAKAMFDGAAGWPWLLAVSLMSSALVTCLFLQITAAALGDEELLFRGPDSAAGPFTRPAPRQRPALVHGLVATLLALAALWYVQALAPRDLLLAVALNQAALLVPLAALAAWQRVNAVDTFGLRMPGGAVRTATCLAGSTALGAGLFVIGAAALVAVRGTHLSADARHLAERLLELVRGGPWWWACLWVVVLPALGEEIFFRGWLLSACAGERPARGRVVLAVAVQAAAFAAFHLLPERLPQTFALGLVLGWLTLRTRSILPAIMAHAAHNAVPVAFVAFADEGMAGGGAMSATIVATAVGCSVIGAAIVAASTQGSGATGRCDDRA